MEEYLQIVGVKHRFRDPIYGFVYLNDFELKILDTPIFQRLRRIHQLALTKYVYPTAEHSRFVHSIGTMHCATLILSGIFSHKRVSVTMHPDKTYIQTLRFAALLHDIGHLPFSHAAEQEWIGGLSHEDLGQYIILNYRDIREIVQDAGVDINEVAGLLSKKPKAKYKLLHEIISGQLDADRADYLLRDSYCCGVKYGEYDFSRFLQIFTAREDETYGFLSIVIDENDLPVVEDILISRYHYYLQIPFHRTRTAYDLVLKKFLRDNTELLKGFEIASGKIKSIDFDMFCDLDDYFVYERIKAESKRGNRWAKYLMREGHLIPVLDTTTAALTGEFLFKKFVSMLEQDKNFKQDENYFVRQMKVEILKENEYEDQEGEGGVPQRPQLSLLCSEGKNGRNKCVDIRQHSWIFKQFGDNPLKILRVYVLPEIEEKALSLLTSVAESVTRCGV